MISKIIFKLKEKVLSRRDLTPQERRERLRKQIQKENYSVSANYNDFKMSDGIKFKINNNYK